MQIEIKLWAKDTKSNEQNDHFTLLGEKTLTAAAMDW